MVVVFEHGRELSGVGDFREEPRLPFSRFANVVHFRRRGEHVVDDGFRVAVVELKPVLWEVGQELGELVFQPAFLGEFRHDDSSKSLCHCEGPECRAFECASVALALSLFHSEKSVVDFFQNEFYTF